MPKDGRKIKLDSATYVTRVNGKLLLVRKRSSKNRDAPPDSAEEGFVRHPHAKSNKDSQTSSRNNTPPPLPIAKDVANIPLPPLPNTTSWAESPQPEAIMNSLPPNIPIYQKGNRQLALVPLNPQGGSPPPHDLDQPQNYQCSPFPQYQFPPFNPQPPPWMTPGGYIYLPIDGNRIQTVSNMIPDNEVLPQPEGTPSMTTSNEVVPQSQKISSSISRNEVPPQSQPIQNSTPKIRVVSDTQLLPSLIPSTETQHQASTAIARHVCGQCGRQRSPKYHKEHPIIPGEPPGTTFCRKCCNDETSSAASNNSSRKLVEKRLDKNDIKAKRKPERNHISMRKNDSEKKLTSSKKATRYGRLERSSSRRKTRAITPEKATSPGGHRGQSSHQGFGAQLQDAVGYLCGRERSSPLFNQKRRTSRSDSNHEHPVGPHQSREVSSRKAKTSAPISSENNMARRIDSHGQGSLIKPKTVQARQELLVPRSPHEHNDSQQLIRNKQGSFEELNSEKSTSFSEQSARRRRIERSLSGGASPRLTDNAFRDRLLSEGNEVVVVTEHYVRRPKKASSFEDEIITAPMEQQIHKGASNYPQVLTESEALSYSDSHRLQQRRRVRQDQQLIWQNDLSDDDSYSSESGTDSEDEDVSSPRALPLGATARTLVQSQQHKSPCRRSGSRESPLSDVEKDHRGRSLLSAESNHRPPYVRDASDMGTERDAIPSPRLFSEHQFYLEDFSKGTRRLDQIERRVAFQELEDDYGSLGSQSTSAHSLKEARTWYRNE